MKPTEIIINNHTILYDVSLIENIDRLPFDKKALQDQGLLTGQAGGRGQALFFDYQGMSMVLRHFHRGGMVARILGDRYLWTGLSATRAWREWRLLAQLCEWGLPVPQPVAARVIRCGLTYRGDLMTRRIAGAEPLSTRLSNGSFSDALWQRVGACVRRFHDRGVYHADLNAHNILLDEEDRVYIIDFDRGAIRKPGGWREDNQARLLRSLRKLKRQADEHPVQTFAFDETVWPVFLQGYDAGPT